MSTKSATIVGIPLDLGAENLGVDIGPDAFRQKKIIEKLEGVGIKVHDAGDIACADRASLEAGDPKMPYLSEIVRVNEETAKFTEEEIGKGQQVVALGGDHSMNLGVFAGASKVFGGNLGLIYLDAHGDINTPETSISHNIHGMHLASLMGFGPAELINVHGEGPKLAKENLLHIGGSDFDQAEIDLIKNEGLDAFTMLDLLSNSLAPLLKKIDDLAARVPNIWVSFDLDVIDSVYAPGVGIPNQGGLQYREVAAITEYIGKHCNVVGLDLVEYNPLKDSEGKTAELGIEIIAKLLGTNYSWYTNYMDKNKI